MDGKQYATKQPMDTEEIKKIKMYVETNENTRIQKKWKWKHKDPKPVNAAKVVLRSQFIAMQVYLRKQEKSQINNRTLHLKQLEKDHHIKSKVTVREGIHKDQSKINEIESETKVVFEQINKIDKPLTKSSEKRESVQIDKIRN